MFSIRRTVEPTAQPVTLDQAKDHCRVTIDDDDGLINTYIAAATRHAEKIMDRAIMPQTLRLSRSSFPGCRPSLNNPIGTCGFIPQTWGAGLFSYRPIILPRPPLVEVTSLTYLDPTGTRQALDPQYYQVSTDAEPAGVSPAPGSYWPAIAWERPDAVQVTYTAGYDVVPETVELGILGLVAHWYENRESVVLTSSSNAVTIVPQFIDELLLTEAAPTVFDYEA